MNTQSLIQELIKIKAFQIGRFQLKSGLISPFYLDLRLIISYPKLLKTIASLLLKKMEDYSFDLLCGVPYAALPIATAMSLEQELPMIIKRKKLKNYGTKKEIEGHFEQGMNCIVIEDLITSGDSLIDTITSLRSHGLNIHRVAFILDREQGGINKLIANKVEPYSLLTLSQLLTEALSLGYLNKKQLENIQNFIHSSQTIQTL